MNRYYYATVIAVFVTVYLGTNLLVVGMAGLPPGRRAVWLGVVLRRLGRRLKHALDLGVASVLARRARRVRLYALHEMAVRREGRLP